MPTATGRPLSLPRTTQRSTSAASSCLGVGLIFGFQPPLIALSLRAGSLFKLREMGVDRGRLMRVRAVLSARRAPGAEAQHRGNVAGPPGLLLLSRLTAGVVGGSTAAASITASVSRWRPSVCCWRSRSCPTPSLPRSTAHHALAAAPLGVRHLCRRRATGAAGAGHARARPWRWSSGEAGSCQSNSALYPAVGTASLNERSPEGAQRATSLSLEAGLFSAGMIVLFPLFRGLTRIDFGVAYLWTFVALLVGSVEFVALVWGLKRRRQRSYSE